MDKIIIMQTIKSLEKIKTERMQAIKYLKTKGYDLDYKIMNEISEILNVAIAKINNIKTN